MLAKPRVAPSAVFWHRIVCGGYLVEFRCMAKVLLIEDDQQLCKMIRDRLVHELYVVEVVHTGSEGLDRLLTCHYDVIILDWDLPEIDGLALLKRFRENGGKTPVLMLTGKGQESDKVAGLDCGADDYLTKPFSVREFTARLRALMRRTSDVSPGEIQRGDLVLDQQRCTLSRGGIDIRLQPAEYALMEFLMRNPGRLFSADDLINRAWNSESEATANSVRILITRLRKKIDVEGKPSLIVTVSKLGYRFEPRS